MDLLAALLEPSLLTVFQAELAGDQVVFQALAPAVDALTGRPDDDRVALGLEPSRLQIEQAAGLLFRPGRPPGGIRGRIAPRPGKKDRQEIAIDLVAGTGGIDPQHVDAIFQRDKLLKGIEMEGALAGDLDGSAVGDRLVVDLQVHLHLPPQLKRLYAADVGTAFFPLSLSFQQLDEHLLAAAGVRSHVELHRLPRPDPLFRDIQVPGEHQQMVLGAAMLPLAADDDRPVEPAVDQSADAGLCQVQGLIELQKRAVGRFQHQRLADPLLGTEVRGIGRVDHHARIDLHAAVAEIGVVAQQQLHLVALEHLGIGEQGRAAGKKRGQHRKPVGRVAVVSGVLRGPATGLPPRGGFDQRNGDQSIGPIDDQHHGQAHRAAQDARVGACKTRSCAKVKEQRSEAPLLSHAMAPYELHAAAHAR